MRLRRQVEAKVQAESAHDRSGFPLNLDLNLNLSGLDLP
jgi:hypothetical protein